MSIHPFREHIPSGVNLLQIYNNYFKHANNVLIFPKEIAKYAGDCSATTHIF